MEANATFWDHLEEFRTTILRALAIIAFGLLLCLYFYRDLFTLLTLPLNESQQLFVMGPVEGIMTTIKVSFWVSLVATSPFWLYLIFRFIAPALQKKEKSVLFPFLFLSLLFLSLGLAFAFFITIPLANQYLVAFNQGIGVNLWSLSNYLDYTVILLLGHALAFEFAALLLLLVHYGLMKAVWMQKMRPYMYVGAFIIGALLTPPDILTQMLLAIPLIGLYELTLLYAKIRQ